MTSPVKPIVLVVEDDPAIARLLAFQLRAAGWEPRLAADGLAALRLWGEIAPALILLDVMLPDLSGWELCGIFRAESSVPIVMLTAKAADNDVVRGLNLGADDYLAKPFSNAQLLARIAAVLRRAAAQQVPAQRLEGATAGRPGETEHDEPAPPPPMPESAPVAGNVLLREARLNAGLSLYTAERRTGIRWDYIQSLEHGAFGSIPRAMLKDMMLRYCAFLNVDARPVFAHAQRILIPAEEQRRLLRPSMIILSATIIILIILPFVLR